MDAPPKHYTVYWEDQRVLDVRDTPGALVSVSAPPPRPGETPPTHPFLSASAYAPEHEGRLREVLDRSDSTDGYLANLRDLGYRVEEAAG